MKINHLLLLTLFCVLIPSMICGGKKRRRNNRNDDSYSKKKSPCDCFEVILQDGYPETIGSKVCYRYTISKKDDKCSADLHYFILGLSDNECGVKLSDLEDLILDSSNDDYIDVPYKARRRHGTKVSGIRIDQGCNDNDQEFEICFDRTKVGGVQEVGNIGLRDTKGNGESCQVMGTLPDFCGGTSPNIIFFLMDDLGLTDTGYYSNYENNNNYSFSTPNIESLADKGIKLNYHYVEPQCSITRSAFLSGRYAWRTGLDNVLGVASGFQTNLNFTLFPEILQSLNYNTYLLGKWHIGYKSLESLPFNRGFDECLFFTLGAIDYYSKLIRPRWAYFDAEAPNLPQDLLDERDELYGTVSFDGYDLWDTSYTPYKEDDFGDWSERIFTNKAIEYIYQQQYEENPFFIYYAMPTPHTPIIDPPITNYTQCESITDVGRARFCQMVLEADSLIGDIVDALKSTGLYDDTIIIFGSDNGASAGRGEGQTLPLRGRKSNKFEGGIRTAGFISGGYLENMQLECDSYDGLFYVTDWYLTILQMTGLDEVDDFEDLDGFPLWKRILNSCKANYGEYEEEYTQYQPRNMIISARLCDDSYFAGSYIRYNEWKLIVNGTYRTCEDGPSNERSNYYQTFDVVGTTFIPPETIYEQYIENEDYGDYFRSECYDELDSTQRNNASNFVYDDLMLFNVETDAIEACDVKDDNMDIVEELLELLFDYVVGNYFGSTQGPPLAASALGMVESYSCEFDENYIISWDDSECCNNDTFNDWEYVWTRAIEIKQQCLNSSNSTL